MRKCPFCAADIADDAARCDSCDRLLPADERVRGAEYRPELPPTELREREVDPRRDEDPDGDVVGRL